MVVGPLFSGISRNHLKEFSKDFLEMVRVSSEMDRYFVKGLEDFDVYIKEFEKIVKDFNKKYKGIVLKTKKKIDCYELRIFLKEKDLRSFFENSAAKIKGISTLGVRNFDEVSIQETDKVSELIDRLKGSLYVSYSDAQVGTSNLAGKFKPKNKMVELVVDTKELMNENSADFKVASFYGVKDGVNSKIRIHNQLIEFGFYNLLDEIEKREWHEKFSPRFLE